MTVQASCPHCSTSYSLAETQIGKKVRCKQCSEAFVVSGPTPLSRSRDEDDDRDEPRRPQPKKKGMPTGLLVGLCIGVFVLLLGCLGGGGVLLWMYGPFSNKITAENYQKIKQGMTEAEVKSILGEPTEVRADRSNMRVLVWHYKGNLVQIVFSNDKVTIMQGMFIDTDKLKRRLRQ
jgi:predicted Zn finger-like uncharacterized protein